MRAFIRYFADYLRNSSRPALFITLLFVAALVAGNYTFGIEWRIQALPWYAALGGFFGFYALVVALVWGLQFEWGYKDRSLTAAPTLRGGRSKSIQISASAPPSGYFKPKMLLILALACLYFSLKMVHWSLPLPQGITPPWDRYTALVLQLPLKLLLLFIFLFAMYKGGLFAGENPDREKPDRENLVGENPDRENLAAENLNRENLAAAVGLTRRNNKLAPYFLLLLAVLPLIALAATQPDFQSVYPKLRNLSFIDGYAHPSWPWKLLYELSYGLDFLGIELFFRGLLVIALLRFAGTDAILPMAAFYCTIHFGKPLGECISSFFGGLILGVLAARTRSILGGLTVHLGLAWCMELAGWIAMNWHH
ncbi:MAG TPA: CPBP family intramembrane glutamic endopeptidase [Puia sp.]|nr:CPBP family intramembrane glutamic endopeptidase [Puia sp.]HWB93054.1 CPBP family intramembrane glutamic endopeptidase [Puia sp.]